MAADRSRKMLTSEQLTLGELTLKLEAVADKSLPVTFDVDGYKPTGLGSWRGSYVELAIQYEGGGMNCYEQPKPECKRDEFGDHDYKCPCGGSNQHSTTLPESPTVQDLLAVLKLSNGKYFEGYKGGDCTMGKTTPIWVANYGDSSGFKSDKEHGKYDQAVVGVETLPGKVVIKTEPMNY